MPNYLKTCSASFPRAQSASFLLSTLIPFQRVLEESAVAAAQGLILVEVDAKCQFILDAGY